MTEIENQTLNLLKILIENREEIYERLAPRLNIVDILGYKERETSNSKLLYYLFNTHFKYYDKEINFAKDFALYFVNKNYKNEIKEAKFENVYRKFQTKEGRRIDILIVFNKFEIIIENKINANALENQLGDYYIDRDNVKLVFLVYLTRGGYEASKYSIGKVNIEKDKIYYLSHDDIAKWIEDDILNKYEFLKFDEKYQSIYSALIQIRDNEKIITNPNRENNMEKEEIKKFFEENKYFEALLKDVNDVDKKVIELNKFYELLENAQNVILDKKVELVSDDINYSLKVSEFLKNAKSNEDGDYMKYATFCDEKFIRSYFTNYFSNNHLQNIIIPINDFGRGLCITVEQRIDFINWHFPLLVSIYSENKILKDELLEKHIKEIEDILVNNNNKDKYIKFPDYEYVCCLYINTKEDKAEDIANKIIKLYEFLDNINFDNV